MARSRILKTLAELERFYHKNLAHPAFFNYTFDLTDELKNSSAFKMVGRVKNTHAGKVAPLYAMTTHGFFDSLDEDGKRDYLIQHGMLNSHLPGYQYSELSYNTGLSDCRVSFPREGGKGEWHAVPGTLTASERVGISVNLFRKTPAGEDDGKKDIVRRPSIVILRDPKTGNIEGPGRPAIVGSFRVGIDRQGSTDALTYFPLSLRTATSVVAPIDSIDRHHSSTGMWSLSNGYLTVSVPALYVEPERKAQPIKRQPPKKPKPVAAVRLKQPKKTARKKKP